MNQNELREKLIYCMEVIGLKARNIGEVTGICYQDMSRFKCGKILLNQTDYNKLDTYLNNAISFYNQQIKQ